MEVPFYYFLFGLYTAILFPEFSHAYEMSVTPSWFTGRNQTKVVVVCVARGEEAKNLISTQISKHEFPIASYQNRLVTDLVKGGRAKTLRHYQIIDQKGGVQEIRELLSIDSLTPNDTGTYHCLFNYNHNGEIKIQDVHSYVVVSDPTISDLEDELKELQVEVEQVETELTQLTRQASSANETIFRVVGGDEAIPVNLNSNIIFPAVHLNHGNGYDVTTGLFTAPTTGVYVLELDLKLDCSQCFARIKLQSDKKEIHSLLLDGASRLHMVDYTTPVRLEAGEKVRLYAYEEVKLNTFVLKASSSFSGYLLANSLASEL